MQWHANCFLTAYLEIINLKWSEEKLEGGDGTSDEKFGMAPETRNGAAEKVNGK